MKTYKPDKIKLQHNNKTGEAGTIDIFRGCPGCEMKNAPCYASKGASRIGIDFFSPVRREFDKNLLEKQLQKYNLDWVRIGCISDPSLDWSTTCDVVDLIHAEKKTSVIITKVYNTPTASQLERLSKAKALLQISVCGVTPKKKIKQRQQVVLTAKEIGIEVSWRINSAIWKPKSRAERTQLHLVTFAQGQQIPILDTPIRLFKTSPFWNLVSQDSYHRHLSPISGKLDNQRTAGLLIKDAYPCYSTCADGPKDNDPVGCPHQCLTRI